MMRAIRWCRPGGHVGYVGVAHGVELPADELFFSGVHLHGGARARTPLPAASDPVDLGPENRSRKVFDLTLPIDQAAEGYRATDDRRAVKVLLTV